MFFKFSYFQNLSKMQNVLKINLEIKYFKNFSKNKCIKKIIIA